MELAPSVLFYIFSAISIVAALFVVRSSKPTIAVLSLAASMVALAGLFVLLRAYFVAVIQVLIYAGAIVVLFLFVVMLLGMETTIPLKLTSRKRAAAIGVLLGAFALELAFLVIRLPQAGLGQAPEGTVEAVGKRLLTDYVFPFELISGVLLVAIIGIVALTGKQNGEKS